MADYSVVTEFVSNASEALDSFRSMVASLTKMRGAFAEVDAASAGFDERMAAIGEAASAASKEISALAEKTASLDGAFAGADEGASSTSRALSSVGEAGTTASDELASAASRMTEELDALSATVARSAEQVDTAFTSMADRAVTSSEEITAAAERTVASIDALGSSSEALGAKSAAGAAGLEGARSTLLGMGAALGITDLATAKLAGSFESNMTRLQTEAGLTDQQIQQFGGSMQGVEDKVLAVGNATGFAGTEIANALYDPVSTAFSLAQSQHIVKVSAEEAKISNSSLADTTAGLSSVMKDFGSSISSPEEGIASLNAIVGAGRMRFQEFDESVKTWAPTASTFGVSLDSVGAALAYMVDRGESAQTAGTKLAQVMAMLVGQTTQAGKLMTGLGLSTDDVATSNQAMAEAMSSAHITTSQLADDLKKPDGLEVALSDLKTHLQDAGLSADAADSVLVRAFGGGRQFKGMAELLDNLPQLKDKFDQIAHDENVAHFEEQWQRVSDTFQQHWADMLAAVKNFAIQIGGTMLPMFTTVSDIFGKMFSLVSQNSDAMHGLGVAFGAMSVAIPVAGLALFISKLSETTIAAAGTIVQLGLVAAGFDYGMSHMDSFTGQLALVISSFQGISLAVNVLEGPLGKIGGWIENAGSAFGDFISSIAGAEGAIGKLSTAGSGLISFMSGPWGLAIMAAVAGIGLLISNSQSGSKAVDDLTQAIQKDNDALGQNAQKWVENQLRQSGAYDQAAKLGISAGDVTYAVLHQGSALDSLNSKLASYAKDVNPIASSALGELQQKFSGNTDSAAQNALAAGKLGSALNDLVPKVGASQQAADDQSKAAADAATKNRDLAESALTTGNSESTLAGDTQFVSGALNDATQAAKDLKDQLDLLNGGNIGAEKASLAFKDSLDKMAKSLKDNGTSFDDTTTKGQANTKALLDTAEAASTHGQAVAKMTDDVNKGNEAFAKDVQAMQDTMGQAHLTGDAIAALTKLYMAVPGDRNTMLTADDKQALDALGITQDTIDHLQSKKEIEIQVNGDAAVQAAARVQGGLDALHDKLVTVTVSTQWGAGVQVPGEGVLTKATGGVVQGFASGGMPRFDLGGFFSGAGTSSSDSNMVALSDEEFVVRARGVQEAGVPVLDALNAGDLRGAYDLLGAKPGVASGSDGAALVGAGSSGGGSVVNVNITVQGSLVHQGQLVDEIRASVLRYAGRNSSAGWTAPAFA